MIGTGTTAFNALEKIDAGSNIAIVGTGHLAYLTTQFAKKVFGFHTTILGYSGSEELAKEWGADAYIALSKEAITKNNEKFKAIVIADVMKEEDVFIIHEVVWRNGGVVFAIDMGFDPKMIALSMICSTSTSSQAKSTLPESREDRTGNQSRP